MEQSGNAMKQGFLGHLCVVSVHQDHWSHWETYPIPAVLRLHHSSLDLKEIHLKAFDTNEICPLMFFLSFLTIECLGQHGRAVWADTICFKWIHLK